MRNQLPPLHPHHSMSTPSTLPPHHPNYGYSHHSNYQSTSGYRANNNHSNGGSRLGAPYTFPPAPAPAPASSNDTSSTATTAPDPSRTSTSRNAAPIPTRPTLKTEAMPQTSSTTAKPNTKKRQRSREPRKPDWQNFYANGLPQEVIVIDDSPTPEPNSTSLASNTQGGRSTVADSSRQPVKKRKRDDVGTAYDPVYQNGHSNSINHTPDYKHSASGSTISTDRTTSAIHTTAATSLGSHSSNGQNGYDAAESQPGHKRKRTNTRLQIANEAKRREQEVNGDAYTNYKPPPRPPIKAADIQVKVVSDVSS